MRRRHLLTGLSLLALSLSGCGEQILEPDEVHVAVTTDSDTYVASYISGEGAYATYGFTVVARVQNLSPGAVYLARCFPDSPQPLIAIELVDDSDPHGAAYDGPAACVGHDEQIRLGPGEVRVDEIFFQGPTSVLHVEQEPLGSFAGQMRIRYIIQRCRGDGMCKAPRDVGVSNIISVSRDTDR